MNENLPPEVAKFVGKLVDLNVMQQIKNEMRIPLWKAYYVWSTEFPFSEYDPAYSPFIVLHNNLNEGMHVSVAFRDCLETIKETIETELLPKVEGEPWEREANRLFQIMEEVQDQVDTSDLDLDADVDEEEGVDEEMVHADAKVLPRRLTNCFQKFKNEYVSLVRDYITKNLDRFLWGYELQGNYFGTGVSVFVEVSRRIVDIQIRWGNLEEPHKRAHTTVFEKRLKSITAD